MAQNILNPLAQTFTVDEETYKSGFFLHSVDLWFTNKDQTEPLKIQIRPVVNGYPSDSIVPFSEVSVMADDITLTEMPKLSNATNIEFETPPYLPSGNEYALVILSNTVNHELYVSRVGDFALDQNTGLPTQKVISSQPFSGVLFKASNSSTFIAVPEEDLMFRIYKCNFQTGTFGGIMRTQFDDAQTEELSNAPILKPNTVHFKHDGSGETGKFSYNAYKINTIQIKDSEDITEPTYQYLDRIMTDEVTGASAASLTYKDTNVNETVYRQVLSDTAIQSPDNRTGTGIIEENQPDSFNLKVSFGTSSSDVSPLIDTQQMNTIFIQNRIDDLEINPDTELTIKDGGHTFAVNDALLVYNSDLEVDNTDVNRPVGGLTTGLHSQILTHISAQTGFNDGKETNHGYLRVSAISGVTLSGTQTVAAFKVGEVVTQVLSGTNATGTVTGTSQWTSGSGKIAVLADAGSPAFKAISTDPHTEVITGTTSGAKLGASNTAITLDAAKGAISALSNPTSANDKNRARRLSGSIFIGTTSIVGGYGQKAVIQVNDELDPAGGIADARYISKVMMLKEGFESEDIKVILNAVRPKGTQIYVYARIKAAADTEAFDTRPFIRLFQLTNPDDVSQKDTDSLSLEFVSYRKFSDGSIDQSTVGGTRYTNNGANYEKFNEYQVKIVMVSESTNLVPLIESYGAIALIDPIQPAS